MEKRVAPSVALEAAITDLPVDAGDPERLAEIGKLGTPLVLQRAVEEEVTAFLGPCALRADGGGLLVPERQPTSAGADRGRRAGDPDATAARLRREVRLPGHPDKRTIIRTRPLEALVIGAYVRGLSERDIESRLQEAGLSKGLQ